MARVAKRHGVPVIAIAGSLTSDYQVVHQHGIDAAFSVLDGIVTLEEALAGADRNLQVTARNGGGVATGARGRPTGIACCCYRFRCTTFPLQ